MKKDRYFMTDFDRDPSTKVYASIWDLMSDMRNEVEYFVSAYNLDVMYDTMRLGRATQGDRFYWVVRECGTYLLKQGDDRTAERLDMYKKAYSNRRIFVIECTGEGFEMELLENTYDVE